eukprot:2542831-Pyramimonas_sp.AAC.1
MAATFALYVRGQLLLKRLLPPVRVGRGFVDTRAKTLALLWQILLVTGRDRAWDFTERVRGLVTDMGTEFGV